jgi:hypothetical protein
MNASFLQVNRASALPQAKRRATFIIPAPWISG